MRFFKNSIQFAVVFFILWHMAELVHKRGVQKTLDRMRDVGAYVQKVIAPYHPEDVLCLFDIDMTLTQPDHPAIYIPNVRKHSDIYHALQKRYPKQDTSLTFLYNFRQPQRMIDADIFGVLKQLPVKTIALTATLTGDFHGQRIEEMRYQNLKTLGISFENAFPEQQDFPIDNCPTYRGNYPMFYKGILLSNSESGTTNKGTVLCGFLKKIGWTPKCIVLVDDRVQNHADVYDELKHQFPETQYIGIEFTGAANYCPQAITEADFERFWADCFEKASHLPNANSDQFLPSSDWFEKASTNESPAP